MVTDQTVLNALRSVQDPDLHRDIVDLGFIKNLRICEGSVGFDIELTTPACPVREQMKQQAHDAVRSISGVREVNIKMTSQVRPSRGMQKDQLVPLVKNILPVASGKGGVGKSTVAANLALALNRTGAKVGVMDADCYGPSIPKILGVENAPRQGEGGRMIPPIAHGVKVISMGFFMKPDEATIWRGPMLHKMIQQFLGAVEWGELDYLVIDLPPGTGDVQLSLCQMVPLTGAVVVTTPQDVALNVAEKAIFMFRKLNTPVLGIVENMSYYRCGHCGTRDDIFGSGGGRKSAERLGIPFLGEIPLATAIRVTADAGNPIVDAQPDSELAQAYHRVAGALAAQISIRAMTEEAPVKITF